jgi:uncharacterized protein with PIN domain
MANKPGPQPDIKYCPACKGEIQNVSRETMRSRGYKHSDGTIAQDTHTYECLMCYRRFEINQDR